MQKLQYSQKKLYEVHERNFMSVIAGGHVLELLLTWQYVVILIYIMDTFYLRQLVIIVPHVNEICPHLLWSSINLLLSDKQTLLL